MPSPKKFQKNVSTSPRAQKHGMDNFESQHANSTVASHQSMSPRWGLNAKGMSVLKGKESASPRDIVSQEKLPKVVGGMKAITVREVKDKKYSRDIGTALSPQASAICPDKSEESVYKI